MTRAPDADEIVGFWRAAGWDKWFTHDPEFDRQIGERFGEAHAAAAAGQLDAWAQTPQGALALILLLDQFSRNLARGSAQAFAQDAAALHIAERAISKNFDRDVDPGLRSFFYLPFMHSERIADQRRSVRLCHALADCANLRSAREHERIIRRFGRFPHRNSRLGRHNSPAETIFLETGGFSG